MELRELQNDFKQSFQGEDLAEFIKQVHELVKETLKSTVEKYKVHADHKKRYVSFKIGDQVWAYLNKCGLPKGKYTKLQMRKIGSCHIIHKFGDIAYEISLPPNLAISPIFNVCDLTPFRSIASDNNSLQEADDEQVEWLKDLPPSQTLQLEKVLDTKVVKQTRKNIYKEYLVKWRGLLDLDATWMDEQTIIKHGTTLQELLSSRNLS